MAKPKASVPSGAEIDAILDRFLQGTEITQAQAEADLARLEPVRGKVSARLLPRVADPDPDVRTAARNVLGELADKSIFPPLRRMLADTSLSDEIRIEIYGLLSDLEVPVDRDEFLKSLADPEAAMQRMLERNVAGWEDPERLSTWVAVSSDRLPPGVQAAYIGDVAALGDDRALPFFLAMLQSEHAEVVAAALDALDRLGNPAALPDLQDLAAYHINTGLRERARQVAEGLAAGLTRPAPAYVLPPVEQALLTTIDGDGGQIAFVSRRHPGGRLALLNVMFNDHEGVKDAMGRSSIDPDEFAGLLDDLEDEGIVPVEVGLTRVRDAVEAARLLSLKIGRTLPADFIIWRHLLSGEDLNPQPPPPLPSVDLAAEPELLDGAYELMDLDEFDAWFFNPPELRGLPDRVRRLKADAHFAGRLGQLIREAIPAIVPPTKRRIVRLRLLRQAGLLAQIYRDRPEIVRWAVAAAEGLADGSPVLPEDHALLQEMVIRSLENALERPLRGTE